MGFCWDRKLQESIGYRKTIRPEKDSDNRLENDLLNRDDVNGTLDKSRGLGYFKTSTDEKER